MEQQPLLKPKTITVQDCEKNDHTFIISRIPAIEAREIITQYPIANMPKLGDYQVSQEIMLKMMCYVAKEMNGEIITIRTAALVNNHVPDWECLARIEKAMMEYNCSFFLDGTISGFFDGVVQNITTKIFAMLTQSSGLSSAQEKQPFKS